jgi:RNA polymerase sigma-70 factor (ECF subfamily)
VSDHPQHDAQSNNERDLSAVSRVLRGETEAYREIVRAYEPVVRRLAVKYLPREEDAQDAVQEIFLKAYRSLGSFRLDQRFLPWLYSVALNHLKTVYRRSRRIYDREGPQEFSAADERDGPEQAALEKAAQEEVRRAVDRLPDSLRDVVVLYYLQGAQVEDVQEALGLGRENVKSRLFRARKRLRGLLDPPATEE